MTSTWTARPTAAHISEIAKQALKDGWLDGSGRAVLVHDLDRMGARLKAVQDAFPDTALHAAAIKAQPVVSILRALVLQGAGLEAASIEEVALARAAGCPADRIVFDSPAKTQLELAQSLEWGIRINADNPAELERIDGLLAQRPSRSTIGLRLNPALGAGAIATTSVADRRSRFGVTLDNPDEVRGLYARYGWLTAVHLHVGSQGCTQDLLVRSAVRVAGFVAALHQDLGRAQVTTVDIGGGLPAIYSEGQAIPDVAGYVDALRDAAPLLFSDNISLVTEFGRSLHAPCGLAISRVEYTKEIDGEPLAVLHVGADLLLRAVYRPDEWAHEFLVLTPTGEPRSGPTRGWRLAGPLCFGGDVVARRAELPELRPGDLVVIRDVGAYTLSMWSRHCSRGIPAVLGRVDGELTLLRRAETPESMVAYWGLHAGGG
ncbi:MAG: diaminopimelate decarboxylase [Deltaproteobacteria bacterium]|nr:diaminopimelate decarboxylase [Deltaproteobacteria bacterium]